ncbi:hypothetical protein AKJ36_03165 [candidate division MSBL1 archaeon SCGC-AAA259I07]|uniref:PIN domain-containing protein n=1 Tax=candidate division MSBL1 archaeon SCGC-AAA259I07 TaxID=1698266 RepID=A0A133UJK8_9EURY|nr:hypothetical protein AKJ36_03165 [candidate division MSBL1 archaeon SCGC-AAA259I07]
MAKINLLRKASKELTLIIPNVIKKESIRKDTYDAKLIKKLIKEDEIKVENPESSAEAERLKEEFAMEEEAHAIVLADEKDCVLATDDGQAIKACKILDIKFTTAVDFLIRAYERNELSREIALEKLDKLETYGRYSPKIMEFARGKIGGEKE